MQKKWQKKTHQLNLQKMSKIKLSKLSVEKIREEQLSLKKDLEERINKFNKKAGMHIEEIYISHREDKGEISTKLELKFSHPIQWVGKYD